MNQSEFLNGYITALLWSSTDDNGEPLDNGEYQLAPEARAKCAEDCARFMAMAQIDLAKYEASRSHSLDYSVSECAGHDFWLTRNGHGVGFLDRGLDELGDRLTALCGHGSPFPPVDAYVGDDGKVYLS